MFRSALSHSKLLFAATATAAALVLAPAAAQAQRPLSTSIVEYGGPGHSATVFVHGTHGHNNFVVDWRENQITVRSLTGEKITAGYGCGWKAEWQSVTCRTPYKVVVNMHSANDVVRMTEVARNYSVSEIWGGQGSDQIQVARGPKQSILIGGDDNDLLIGSWNREALFGGPGNDTIRPGGGPDHIDGGDGAFNGGPFVRNYERNDGECAGRTHGYWDRLYPNIEGPEGYDTLDLSNLYEGALADLNICRLGWHTNGQPGLVHAIERVIGTSHNDRLVGDEDNNVLIGGAGNDWITGEGGADRIESQDGAVDTVKCSPGGDTLTTDAWDGRIGC